MRTVLAHALAVFLTLNGLLCAAASLLALAGPASPLLDVLSHFALIYLAAAVVGMVLALMLRNWGRPTAFVLTGATAAASLALIGPELLRDAGPRAAAPAAGQVKIVQFNALKTNADVQRSVDWIVAQQPDIVTVQEARPDLRDALVRRTGWQVAGSRGNLMILSRRQRLVMDRPTVRGPLHWVNATYPSDSGPLEVVTIHHDWPTNALHLQQQAALVELVGELPRERMILSGDFNSASWSADLRRADRSLGLIRRDRALASFPATRRGFLWPWPVLPIDHVYAGPGWATVKVERGPRLGSDHYPLVVTLAPVSPR